MIRTFKSIAAALCAIGLLSGCSIAGKPEWDQPVMYQLKVSVPQH